MPCSNKGLQETFKEKGMIGAIDYCKEWRAEIDAAKKELEEQSEGMEPKHLFEKKLEIDHRIRELIKNINVLTGAANR